MTSILQTVNHGRRAIKDSNTDYKVSGKADVGNDNAYDYLAVSLYKLDDEDGDSAYESLEVDDGNIPNFNLISKVIDTKKIDKQENTFLNESPNICASNTPNVNDIFETHTSLLSSEDVQLQELVVFEASDELNINTITAENHNDDDHILFELVGENIGNNFVQPSIDVFETTYHFPERSKEKCPDVDLTDLHELDKDDSICIDNEALDLNNFESNVGKAYVQSVKSKSLSPLIKEELKCKIQCRRLLNGMPVLFDEEPEKNKDYKLTDEEVEKKNARLEQNRRSARRARQRTKQSEDKLNKYVEESEECKSRLSQTVKQLRKERDSILADLKRHLLFCKRKRIAQYHRTIVDFLGH